MSRLNAFIAEQLRIVSGEMAPCLLTVEDSEGSRMFTLPINRESDTAEALERRLDEHFILIEESYPAGRHPCKICSYFPNGTVSAWVPKMVIGKSPAQATIGNEARAMQHAVAMMVDNSKSLMVAQNEALQRQATLLQTSEEDRQIMMETVNKMLTESQDRDIKAAESLHKMNMMETGFNTLKDVIVPVLLPAISAVMELATLTMSTKVEKLKAEKIAELASIKALAPKEAPKEPADEPRQTANERPNESSPIVDNGRKETEGSHRRSAARDNGPRVRGSRPRDAKKTKPKKGK